MILVGAQLAPQAPLNRELSRLTSGISAAFVSFLVGLLVVVAACGVAGELGGVWDVWQMPPGHAAGGLLGAAFVLAALLGVGAIGASGVAGAAVSGQLIASVGLDAAGALHLESRPITLPLLAGAAAVLGGTYLVVRGTGNGVSRERTLRARIVPALAVVAGGAMMGVQHPLNGDLAGSIGDLPASVVNFAVASLALLLALVVAGQAPRLAGLVRARAPWYYFAGGLFGSINATAALILVGRIGAGAVAAAAVTGQIVASLALDRAGVFGLERRPVDARRLCGAALLIGGTVLIAL